LGNILFVDWPHVGRLFLLYAAVGLLHWLWRQNFLLISEDPAEARTRGLRVRLWDFLFYASFALVVTSSVRIAGVILVFTYLVVPAVAAILFCRTVRGRLLFGWMFGVVGSVLGLVVSVQGDLPTGASIVAAFGTLLAGCAAWRQLLRIAR
jgi:zinc/manganese transport system permease protein